MKEIRIDNNRKLNQSSLVLGYLNENKAEQIQFIIPDKYSQYSKKACFKANGNSFSIAFDDNINNILTITSEITRYKELDMTIEFFRTDNDDEIVAKTSMLHLIFQDAIDCEDITETEPKKIILDQLITDVNQVIEKTNNLDIDIDNSVVTITKKDGTVKTANVKGEKGDPGRFQVYIVEKLPTTGEDGTLYLVKKDTTGTDDLYNEYIYADGQWNLIGNTHIDLSDYYTKNETYSKQEIDDAFDTVEQNISEVEAGVELDGNYQDNQLTLTLLDNTSNQLSKMNIEIPQYQEIHYTWDGTTGDEAKEIFQMVYSYYKRGKIINVDLSYNGKMYKLTNISNPANKGNEIYCQFMTLDYYTDKTDFVFMQSVNAVLTLNSGIVENITENESINKFRLIREYDGLNGALPTNNTKEYTPTMPYEPATKKYVDETHYKNFIGYSSSKTQILKNINGVLQWVDG